MKIFKKETYLDLSKIHEIHGRDLFRLIKEEK